MKKAVWLVALMGVFAMVGQVWAGGACCPASKAQKAAYEKSGACTSALSGMELTADQKDQIAKIEADCKAEGMTVDACSKSMSKIRDVLTDDQKAAFDSATSKSGAAKAGCGG